MLVTCWFFILHTKDCYSSSSSGSGSGSGSSSSSSSSSSSIAKMWPLSQDIVSLAYEQSDPKRHLDRLSCFCHAHSCDEQTDRQTDTHTDHAMYNICSSSLHQELLTDQKYSPVVMLMSMWLQQGLQDADTTQHDAAASGMAPHGTWEPRRWLLRVTGTRSHSTKDWLCTQRLLPCSEACHNQSQGSQDWGTFFVCYLPLLCHIC